MWPRVAIWASTQCWVSSPSFVVGTKKTADSLDKSAETWGELICMYVYYIYLYIKKAGSWFGIIECDSPYYTV